MLFRSNGGVETSCSQSDDDEHEEDEDAVDSAGDVGLVGTERERVCAGGWGNTPLSMHAPDWLSLRLLRAEGVRGAEKSELEESREETSGDRRGKARGTFILTWSLLLSAEG